MSHHHEHHHHAHAHTHTANKKVLRVSFVIIAAFMLLEAVGGWLTHSLALLSDAGHMFSDAFSLGVALWAFKLGEKETTLQKTFGYKRFEILTAMFNGLSLVVIAVLIFYEAVKRLLYPPEIATLGMLVISVVGLLVNIGVAVYMLKNSDTEANVNMRGAYLHVLSDLVGSIGAIAAAVLMMAFGWKWADPLASVFVAALVGRSGWSLLKQTLHILMERIVQLHPLRHIACLLPIQQRHPVVRRLPGKDHPIPRRLDLILRKLVIRQLRFLQTQEIHRIGSQPVQHMLQTHLQRIDIPCRQLHSGAP